MEILAPAGNLEILKIAIQAGCDAVYISGKHFGARKFAPNFSDEELEIAVSYAHLRKKKVYVTINTIVYDEEWSKLDAYLKLLSKIKVDAIIVQDLGVISYVKQYYPQLPMHASTQMNIHNVDGAIQLLKLGVKRVVLARETPLEIIKEIIQTGIEVEVFGHGALCFSYSGQCMMSYWIGGRSGNRGECAQPCRRKYALYENNKKIIGPYSLLSMKDLKTLEELDTLLDMGITSLKIEGRMKSASYVATVVKVYRNRMNHLKGNHDEEQLSYAFHRGFTKGYMLGAPNKDVTNLEVVNHQGVKIGTIKTVSKNEIGLQLEKPLALHDAIRIKSHDEIGFYVNNIREENHLFYIKGRFNVKVNDVVYKTVDAKQVEEANGLLHKEMYHIHLNFKFYAYYGKKIRLTIAGENTQIVEEGEIIIQRANHPLTIERIKEQLKKVSSPLFEVENLEIDYDKVGFLSISVINELRRKALQRWQTAYLENYAVPISSSTLLPPPVLRSSSKKMVFEYIVNNEKQLKWCKENGIENVYCHFSNPAKQYVRHFHFQNINLENAMIHNLSDIKKNSVLSPSCNITNTYALTMLDHFQVQTVYLSNELSDSQIFALGKCETNFSKGVFVYGHPEMMITRHCFISKGKGIKKINCGNCKKNTYEIEDEYRNKMFVKANCTEEGPELILYDYQLHNKIDKIKNYFQHQITHFLILFTNETEEEMEKIKEEVEIIQNGE